MTEPAPEQPEGPSARSRPGERLLIRTGNLEYDRVLFFSDAIFAIAITLLVLEIPRSAGTIRVRVNGRVESRAPGTAYILQHVAGAHIISFAISFVVIGMFWMAHHSTFRYITTLDRRLIAMNLALCGVIAFLPYPTALLTEGHGPDQWATMFYAACMTAAGFLELLIWIYAAYGNQLTPGLTAAERRYIALRVLRVPLVFALSIPVALVSAAAAQYFWILIWVTGHLVDRYARPRQREAAGPAG